MSKQTEELTIRAHELAQKYCITGYEAELEHEIRTLICDSIMATLTEFGFKIEAIKDRSPYPSPA